MDINKQIEDFKNKYPNIDINDIRDFLSNIGVNADISYSKISNSLHRKFYDACDDGNIEAIKECLLAGMPISYYSNFIKINAVIHVAQRGHIDAINFFLNDPIVQGNPVHKANTNMDDLSLEIFNYACSNRIIRVVNYLINEHHVENNSKIRDYIKTECSADIKQQIISMIENKYLKYTLELSLDNSNASNKKLKV